MIRTHDAGPRSHRSSQSLERDPRDQASVVFGGVWQGKVGDAPTWSVTSLEGEANVEVGLAFNAKGHLGFMAKAGLGPVGTECVHDQVKFQAAMSCSATKSSRA